MATENPFRAARLQIHQGNMEMHLARAQGEVLWLGPLKDACYHCSMAHPHFLFHFCHTAAACRMDRMMLQLEIRIGRPEKRIGWKRDILAVMARLMRREELDASALLPILRDNPHLEVVQVRNVVEHALVYLRRKGEARLGGDYHIPQIITQYSDLCYCDL